MQGRLYWTRSLGIRSTLHPHINPQSHAHTPPQPLPDFIYATTNGEVCGSVGNKPAGSASIGPVQLIRPKGVSTRCQEPALSAPSPTFIHPPDQEVGRPRNSHSGCAWGCRGTPPTEHLGLASMPCIDHAPPPPLTVANDVPDLLLVSRPRKVTISSHHSPHLLLSFPHYFEARSAAKNPLQPPRAPQMPSRALIHVLSPSAQPAWVWDLPQRNQLWNI